MAKKQSMENVPIKAIINYETSTIKVWVPVSPQRTRGNEVKALNILKGAQLPSVQAKFVGTTRGRVGAQQCRVFLYKIDKS